jgi:hypothetical protein
MVIKIPNLGARRGRVVDAISQELYPRDRAFNTRIMKTKFNCHCLFVLYTESIWSYCKIFRIELSYNVMKGTEYYVSL